MSERWVATLAVLAVIVSAGFVVVAGPLGEDASSSEGPTEVAIRLTHAGSVPIGDGVEGRLVVEDPDETLADRSLRMEPGDETELSWPAKRGNYSVEIALTYSDENTDVRHSSDSTLRTRHCPGEVRSHYRLHVDEDEEGEATDLGIERVFEDSGCFGSPKAAEELLEAARDARDVSGSETVDVPAPGWNDTGTYKSAAGLAPIDWSERDEDPFAWRSFEGFPDAWGRPVDGVELVQETGWSGSASAGAGQSEASTELHVNATVTRFRSGAVDPFASTGGLSVQAVAGPSGATTFALMSMDYDVSAQAACQFRFPLQGQAVQEGTRFSSDAFCPLDEDGDASWYAGEVQDHRGRTALPLYLTDEQDGHHRVVRVWLVDGVPYPIEAEMWAFGGDRPTRHGELRLWRLDQAGEPLVTEPPEVEPADPDLAPIDPLEGPAIEEGSDRFPFTLAQASQAAQRDPTLRDLQTLLEEDDAVLAGAAYGTERDADTATAQATRHMWYMVFSASGADPVGVLCERRRSGSDDLSLSPPSLECEQDREPAWLAAFEPEEVPRMGRDELPAEGATFDMALDRWDLVRADGSEGTVTYGLYRTWETESRWFDRGPALAVGSHVEPAGTPVAGDQQKALSRAQLALASGRLEEVRFGVGATSGTGLPGDALEEGDEAPRLAVAGAGGGGLASALEAPILAGGAALGIIGLVALVLIKGKTIAAGLYSRIGREDVLDHEIRASIRDLVEEDPGVHVQAIADELDLARGQIRHHLRVLTREEILVEVASSGYRRYFVAGTYDVSQMRAMAALRNGQNAKAFRVIRENPGIGVSDLADRAGISASYASKTVDELCKVGLVDKVRDGRAAKLYADEEPRDGA